MLIAGALAGCGPFGEDGDQRLDADEFAARGNEICSAAQDRAAELRADPPTTAAQSARFTRELVAVFREELAQLDQLRPPEEAQDAFDRYLRSRARVVGVLERGVEAAEQEDAAAYADAQAEAAAGQVERAELARKAGLQQCSRPLTGATCAAE